jgi:cytochrome c553
VRGRRDNDTPVRVQPADWFPNDHPYMPQIVAEGDQGRGIIACSLCHYPNGKGRSENASPAGLDRDYIVRQLHDMKNDLRHSAEPRKANTNAMITFAKAMTEQEIQQAATYFSSMKWTPWIKVVESETAPKVRSAGGLYIPLEGADAGMEPIGNRIVEVPVNAEHTETLRDPHSPFIAYVPPGSVEKGKELVTTGGNGKTIQCSICHGEDLNGLGSVPAIAARSPSYLARQLNDIQQGTRKGSMAALMKPVVAKLTPDDILNITAYVASLPAPATVAYQKTAETK